MSLKTDGMSTKKLLSLDDSFVYIPLEDVPDGLLDKLPDFKVIVKDKQGDMIFPKERLGEVLESMDRDESRLPRHTTGGEMSQRNYVNGSKACIRALSQPALNLTPRSSPERQMFTVSNNLDQPKESTPRKYDFSYTDEFGSGKVVTSPVHSEAYNNQTLQRVSKHLNVEPHHPDVLSSPHVQFDSYSFPANDSHCPKKPVKQLHRRLSRIDTGDVSRARKRLVFLGESMKENDRDSLQDPHSCYSYMRSRQVNKGTNFCTRDPKSPSCGLKRKYYLCESEADNAPWITSKYPRRASEIATERQLHGSHPANRQHRDYHNGQSSQHLTNTSRCACSLVKSNLLQMTKSAYEKIQRQNCTPASFEEFRNNLKEINSVLQESFNVLHTVEELCCHE